MSEISVLMKYLLRNPVKLSQIKEIDELTQDLLLTQK